jgi:hypothetical protein
MPLKLFVTLGSVKHIGKSLPLMVRARTFQRVVFPQRVAFPTLRQEYPPQVRMPVEGNTEEVIAFALMPIDSCPYRQNRINRRR